MERVYKELDKVKTEMEELKEECQTKSELSESLKKAHGEQLLKFKEAKLQIKKQDQELNAKSLEISELSQLYENLKSSLHEKESLLSHLRFADEKLRVDFCKRIQELEGENKELASSLDELTIKNRNLELKICAGKEEVESLKNLLLDKTKKSLEAEQHMEATIKELQNRNDVIRRLEEENMNLQDQLKWKNENFTHLEEAHEKGQTQFELSKKEWEVEKSAMVEDICKLQTSFDSQTRNNERLETQLKMCNQALAHEESKRKFLEAEVAEFNLRFENVFTECQEAKAKIEQFDLVRDEKIADLRNLLGTKERAYREMEFRVSQLEQENQELKEAEIEKSKVSNSLKNMESKMKDLEKLHAKWSDRMEKMRDEMKGKSEKIQELEVELENFRFLLEVHNEEIVMVMMVLKSEFSSANSALCSAIVDSEYQIKKKDERILLLTEQFSADFAAKTEAMQIFMQEKEDIGSEIAYLKEELSKKETKGVIRARSEAQNVLDQEKERLSKIMKENDQRIENLLTSFLEKQIEIDVLIEAFKDAENPKRFKEIEEKNREIVKLEVEVNDLYRKLKETEKLKDQFENERRHKEALIEDNMRLSSHNEDLMIEIKRIYEEMCGFCCKDNELNGILAKLLANSEEGDECVDSSLIVNAKFCPSRKGIEDIIDNRLPLVEVNR